MKYVIITLALIFAPGGVGDALAHMETLYPL